MSGKVTATVDYGMEEVPEKKIKNTDGSNRLFSSPAQVLNYMAKQGWELVATYTRGNESYNTSYVMKRKHTADRDSF